MKLLLTSAGISNKSILQALEELLNKTISEATAFYIPTALHAIPNGSDLSYKVVTGSLGAPFCNLGWHSIGILELTALPSIKKELWLPALEKADVLLVGGGDCQYLCYWFHKSGLSRHLPALLNKLVYVGLSAGSMIMTKYGTSFGNHTLPLTTNNALGFVDIAIHPHLNHEWFPDNILANIQKIARNINYPSYAIDDHTAIKIIDNKIEVVSEGEWQLINSEQ